MWSLVELTGGDAEALALNQYEAELQIGQGRSGGFDLSLHSGISRPRPGLSGCTLVIGRAERGDERLRLTERYEVPDEGCTVIDVPAAVVLVEELLAGVGWTQPRDDRLVVTTDDGLTYTFERAEDVSE